MENIDFINKKLKEKAQDRLDSDFKTMIDLIRKNHILSELRIEFEGQTVGIEYLSNRTTSSIATNLVEIKETLLKKYIKEEGDKLLAQMSLIEDYLN